MTTAGNALRVRSRYVAYLVPIAAVLAALALGAIMLVVLDANPIEGFRAMFRGAFGSADALTSTALKATPLLFVGVGITIAFRANVINIGGEGQMVAGGLLATGVALALPDWPAVIMLPTVLIAGLIGGGLWGAVPGTLKAYYGVNEILSTIMLNVVAVQLMNFLLRGPMIDPGEIERGTRIPQTARLQEGADLPLLFGSGRLHIGPLLAVLMAVAAYILLWRTPVGYRLRAVGQSTDAAEYAGMPVKRTIVIQDQIGTQGQCDGMLSLDMNAFAAGALGGNPLASLRVPGTRIHAQVWGRDTVTQSLLSDAIAYTVCQ